MVTDILYEILDVLDEMAAPAQRLRIAEVRKKVNDLEEHGEWLQTLESLTSEDAGK